MLKMICVLFILNLSAPIHKAYILTENKIIYIHWNKPEFCSRSLLFVYASWWILKALAQYGTINLSILLWQKDRNYGSIVKVVW